MNKTLYVRHSGQAMDLSAVEDLFTTVGDVATKNFGDAVKDGVIEMSTEQQAMDCAERFNGYSLNGHALSVKLKPAG